MRALLVVALLTGCAVSDYDKGRQVVTPVEVGRGAVATALDKYDAIHIAALEAQAKAECAGDLACAKSKFDAAAAAYAASPTRERLMKALAAWRAIDEASIAAINIAEAAKKPLDVCKVVSDIKPVVADAIAAAQAFGLAVPSALVAALGGLC